MNIKSISKKFLSLLLCMVMLMSTAVVVMAEPEDGDDQVTTDTANTDVENTDVENTDGENTDGENTDGDNADGENADGENADGEEGEAEEQAFDYLNAQNVFKTADEKLASMVKKVESDEYALYCDEYTGEVAIQNTITGQTLFTNPYDLAGSSSTEDVKGQLMSQIEIRYSDNTGTNTSMFSYKEACLKNQIKVKNLKNGLRVEYSIGDEEVRYLVPMQIEKSRYETLIRSHIEASDLSSRIKNKFTTEVYYVLKDPFDTTLSVGAVKKMQEEFPATKEMAIYVFDTEASKRDIQEIESYIKGYCPEYTYATLEEDHQLTGYTSTQKAPPLFKMALEYYIDENGPQIRLPANGIRFDEDEYQLTYVRILPYFGAGSSAYNGYTFIPDGSGALFDFQQLKTDGGTITGKVYGSDFAYHEITTVKSEIMRLPVYGVVENYVGESATITKELVAETVDEETGEVIPEHEEIVDVQYQPLTEDRGYLAIIEEGDALASITTTHGGSLHRYNSVYTEFYPRPSDSYNLSDSISVGENKVWTIVSNRKYTGSYLIRIVMLTDENKIQDMGLDQNVYYPVSYVGMAKAYQNYLIKQGILTPIEDADEDIPLYIESFGAIDKDSTFLSFPTVVTEALTTFDNLKAMYEGLSAKGVTNVNFRLTGFANGGMSDPSVPTGVKFEKAVGGNEGYADFIKYAEENEITVYPEFDLSYAAKDGMFDGYSASKDAVKSIDNRYTQKRQYYSSLQQTVTTGLICISPASFEKLYNGITEDLNELGKSGISLGNVGADLNSDFDKKDSYNREDSKQLVIQLLEKASEEYASIMVDEGNAYTWKYADTILNVTLDSSHYTKSSRSVPFVGMVLHGCVNFAGKPTNMASDMDYETLKMIENGSLPYFTLSYDNTPLLKEDDKLNRYYSVAYDIWFDDLVTTYTNLNDILGSLQDKKIVNHEFVMGQRVPEEGELEADSAATEAAKENDAVSEKLNAMVEALETPELNETQDGSDNVGLETTDQTEEVPEAEKAGKYDIDDGTIVRVTYEDGTVFILNYNKFAVTVDGVTVNGLSYVKM
ncbi:MAG: hypothetical protein IKT46_05125 [Clostridia bacterium]|nr:hypothetical protein [Clostridia bacterium]